MRKTRIKDDPKIFCLIGKIDLLLKFAICYVSEADLGRETRVQFWTCYF